MSKSSRISDADALRQIAKKLRDADDLSSKNRALVDAMFNGEPPYDPADLAETGQDDRTNLNFNEADAIRSQAASGYYDLVHSVNELVTVQTKFGDEARRLEWSAIISEEFSRMVREWPRFEFYFQRIISEFIDHGVGVSYFPDDLDWRPEAAGLEDFKIPRGTPATEDAIDVAVCHVPLRINALYNSIRDPEAAAAAGWDVAQARELIREALNDDREDKLEDTFTDWEAVESRIKNHLASCGVIY